MIFENDPGLGLVGFWPFNEPSGSPRFYNHATDTTGAISSGITLDMLVTTTDDADSGANSYWPGTDTVLIPDSEAFTGSAITLSGLRIFGDGVDGVDTRGRRLSLIVGQGGFASRTLFEVPGTTAGLVGSGFSIGAWFCPMSNGNVSPGNTNLQLAEQHALISKGRSTSGFHFGVSGKLDKGNQFTVDPNQNPLQAYVHIVNGGQNLTTTIPSGQYTHLLFRYEHVGASNNIIELYKNGNVVASGVTNSELVQIGGLGSAENSPMVIAGSRVRTLTGSERIRRTTGYGHLISGVYAFQRPLDDGEPLLIHNQGGLQPQPLIKDKKEVLITDPSIISYFPFVSPGFPDASKNHFPLISSNDELGEGGTQATILAGVPGPFGRGRVWDHGTNQTNQFMAGSGITEALINAKSFSLAYWYQTQNQQTRYEVSRSCSMGIAGIDNTPPPFPMDAACFDISNPEGNNVTRPRCRIFELGDSTNIVDLLAPDTDVWGSVNTHIAFAYDDQTKGVAFYVNGHLGQSGVLTNSLIDQMELVASYGLPLVFNGGLSSIDGDLFINKPGDSSFSEICIFGRPIEPDEVRFLSEESINISSLLGTILDPRLKGYWSCSEYDSTGGIVVDQSHSYKEFAAHLTPAFSDRMWDLVDASDDESPNYKQDFFRKADIPNELSSFGSLGISSGTWATMGGSLGHQIFTTTGAAEKQSSYGNIQARFKPCTGDRDRTAPHFYNEFVIGFEVTPSGNIPRTTQCQNGQRVNSMIYNFGNGADASYAFLTSVNANNPDPAGFDAGTGPSGVSIVFAGTENTYSSQTSTIASGNLIFGVPNKVLFHVRAENPVNSIETDTEICIGDLWIGGTLVHSNKFEAELGRFWSDQTPSISDDAVLQFGGVAIDDNYSTDIAFQSGLGEIFLRNIFILNGKFIPSEIEEFSMNGVNLTPSVTNYSNVAHPVTSISAADGDIAGYYRMTGGSPSGAEDLSARINNLSNLGQTAAEEGLFPNINTNTATKTRYMPLFNSGGLISTQSSGITFRSPNVSLLFDDANAIAPLAVSGAMFNSPNTGFSIAMWYMPRVITPFTSNVNSKAIISYGLHPVSDTNNADVDASWVVRHDGDENLSLTLSLTGGYYLNRGFNALKSVQVDCGVFRRNIFSAVPANSEPFKIGNVDAVATSSLNHYLWTFDAALGTVKCFLNGVLVDKKLVPNSTFNIPSSEEAKIISFMVPQSEEEWIWNRDFADFGGVLSDFFYMDRSISDSEARFIAFNGFDRIAASGTTSGIYGGHMLGVDVGSGVMGGYLGGLDNASGIVGGFLGAANGASGIIGGMISGQFVPFGFIGAYARGSMDSSGIIGGHISSAEGVSGIVGGYTDGALLSQLVLDMGYSPLFKDNKEFDAVFNIVQTNSAEFDAKYIVFQDELPPSVSIETPAISVGSATVPFNQYFIGVASGTQGKTIESATWSFGDFSPSVRIPESGNGQYPIQHLYLGSGFYVARFDVVDSDGIRNSSIVTVNAASGIDPVNITISGVPRVGNTELLVTFDQKVETAPQGVVVVSQLIDFGDGTSSRSPNTVHGYQEPGVFIPIWMIRDSRGVIYCDTLTAFVDLFSLGGGI